MKITYFVSFMVIAIGFMRVQTVIAQVATQPVGATVTDGASPSPSSPITTTSTTYASPVPSSSSATTSTTFSSPVPSSYSSDSSSPSPSQSKNLDTTPFSVPLTFPTLSSSNAPSPTSATEVPKYSKEEVFSVLAENDVKLNETLAADLLDSMMVLRKDEEMKSGFWTSLDLWLEGVKRFPGQREFNIETRMASVASRQAQAGEEGRVSFEERRTQVMVPPQTLSRFSVDSIVLVSLDFNDVAYFDSEKERFANVTSVSFLTANGSSIDVAKADNPINITVPYHAIPENGFQCIYWDEKKNEWNSTGCETHVSNNTDLPVVYCLCNHLTNFSLGAAPKQPSGAMISSGNSNNSTRNIAIIIPVVIGGILMIVVIAAIIFVKTKKKESEPPIMLESLGEEGEAKFNISSSDIQLHETIGSGASSQVYRGIYQLNTPVAVKKQSKKNSIHFLREVYILSGLHHPNVVQYFGAFKDGDQGLCMVFEYMNSGSLLNAVRNAEDILADKRVLLNILHQVASGMNYISQMGFVHCDLSARNILLRPSDEGSLLAKIADFGIASEAGSAPKEMKDANFPVRWTAPEVLKEGKISSKSDVFSFYVLLWESFEQGKIPFSDLNNEEVISAIASGKRLESSAWPESIRELAMKCSSQLPESRPNFSEVCEVTSEWAKVIVKVDGLSGDIPTNYGGISR